MFWKKEKQKNKGLKVPKEKKQPYDENPQISTRINFSRNPNQSKQKPPIPFEPQVFTFAR